MIEYLLYNWVEEGFKDEKDVTEHFVKSWNEEYRGGENECD